MAKQRQTFDSWRLSRIAEEVESLSFSSTDSTPASSRCGTLERVVMQPEMSKYFNELQSGKSLKPVGDFSINSTTGYCNPREIVMDMKSSPQIDRPDQTKDALRFFKEKYDSLGRIEVQKPTQNLDALPMSRSMEDASIRAGEKYTGVSAASEHQLHSVSTGQLPREYLILPPEMKSLDIPGRRDYIDRPFIQSNISPARLPTTTMSAVSGANPTGFLQVPGSVQSQTVDQRLNQRPMGSPRIIPPPSSPRLPANQSDPVKIQNTMTSQRTSDVTRQELVQVEMFYSSHKTTLSVCPCVASMYLGTSRSLRSLPSLASHSKTPSADKSNWIFYKSGIPVLVLDSGEGRRRRRLHLVLAEKGTGFTLWRDVIDVQSQYTARALTFHTLALSTDRNRVAGLLFDDEKDAEEFQKSLRRLLIDSELSQAREDKVKCKSDKKTSKKATINKAAISQPCCFTHITKLAGKERTGILFSVQSGAKSGDSTPNNILTNDNGLKK